MIEGRENFYRKFIILSGVFVVMTGYGVLLPVLPYYTERLAFKSGILTDEDINLHIGILTSIYPFFQLLFAVIWGKLSDRIGRKSLIIMGLSGFVLMQILTGLAASLSMLYLARILGGIFSSAVIPVSNAFLSDITDRTQRRKVLAWSGVAVSTGVIAGPIIGGYLAQSNLHIYTKIGHLLLDKFSIPFFAVAFLGVVVLILTIWRLKNPSLHRLDVSQKTIKTKMDFKRGFITLLLISSVLQLAITLFETVFSIYAKDILVFEPSQIGLGFMLCGLVMAILQPLFANLDTRIISINMQLLTGFSIAALAMVAFTFWAYAIYVYAMIVLFAIGGAMVAPNLIAMISFIDKDHIGSHIAMQTSFNSIGQILGPILGVWLYTFNAMWPFPVVGAILFLVAISLIPKLRVGLT